MDYEPSFTPHPSYQLEDSSDESDWAEDELPIDSRRKSTSIKELPREPQVHLEGNVDKLQKGGQVVFLIGEAGERLAQGVEVGSHDELIQVRIEREQVSSITAPLCDHPLTKEIPNCSLEQFCLVRVKAAQPSFSSRIRFNCLISTLSPISSSRLLHLLPLPFSPPTTYLPISLPRRTVNPLQLSLPDFQFSTSHLLPPTHPHYQTSARARLSSHTCHRTSSTVSRRLSSSFLPFSLLHLRLFFSSYPLRLLHNLSMDRLLTYHRSLSLPSLPFTTQEVQ